MASPSLRDAWSRQNGLCRYCRRQVPFEQATIDHVVPRCRGGVNKGNTVMACWQCNNRKGDMPVEQFVELLQNEPEVFDRRQRLSQARLQMWMRADGLRCVEERANGQ